MASDTSDYCDYEEDIFEWNDSNIEENEEIQLETSNCKTDIFNFGQNVKDIVEKEF